MSTTTPFEPCEVNVRIKIIAGAAVGEWNYYLLGSAIEVVLLATIIHYARRWPKEPAQTSTANYFGYDAETNESRGAVARP